SGGRLCHSGASTPPGRSRPAFISVGAGCQRLAGATGDALVFSLSGAFFFSLEPAGGTGVAVRRREGVATRRVDSSLRGHRTCGSQCPNVSSGPDKTSFASAGPDSHGRGRRRDGAKRSMTAAAHERLPGRMNAGRGLRADETSPALVGRDGDVINVPPRVTISHVAASRGLVPLLEPGPIRGPFVSGRLLPLVHRAVAGHVEQDAQQPASHRHVGP